MYSLALEYSQNLMNDPIIHIPVMAEEVSRHLTFPPHGCVVDATLGLGGHSELLVQRLGGQGRIIGIDRDESSLKFAKERLKNFADRMRFVHADFRHIDQVLADCGVQKVDGILMDLGISSFQLDNPQRGFSFKDEGPLDMRMDQDGQVCAYDLINSLSERELAQILREYGEERFSHRIAKYLVTARSKKPLQTTQELCETILQAVPRSYWQQKIHPATRTFQAFRIAVNHELESLSVALEKCVQALKPKARLVVIAFHSLEDRIVKHKFRHLARTETVSLITKKPIRPQEIEVQKNARARSARLRVVEKV